MTGRSLPAIIERLFYYEGKAPGADPERIQDRQGKAQGRPEIVGGNAQGQGKKRRNAPGGIGSFQTNGVRPRIHSGGVDVKDYALLNRIIHLLGQSTPGQVRLVSRFILRLSDSAEEPRQPDRPADHPPLAAESPRAAAPQ